MRPDPLYNPSMSSRTPVMHPVDVRRRWSLGPDHTLRLRLENSSKEIVLRSGLVSASAHQLVFSVTSRQPSGSSSTRIFQFQGRWQADEKNRLTFVLTGRKSDRGRLVFQGVWELGRRYEILYRYEAEALARGVKKLQTLALRGLWKIQEKGSLLFLVEGKDNSSFRFRAEFVSSAFERRARGRLRFRIGIGVSGSRRAGVQTLEFSGRWKILPRLALGFELDYGGSRVDEMRFQIQYQIGEKGKIELELLNQKKEGLGIQTALSKKFFNDRAEFFLRGRAMAKEKALEGGVRIPW